MQKKTTKFLYYFVLVGIVLTIGALIMVPEALTIFLKNSDRFVYRPCAVFALTVCIYACALPYVVALFQLKGICKMFVQGQFFESRVSEKFKDISMCAFLDAVLVFMFLIVGIAVFECCCSFLIIFPLLVLSFIGLGIISLTISQVFDYASDMKEENESIF